MTSFPPLIAASESTSTRASPAAGFQVSRVSSLAESSSISRRLASASPISRYGPPPAGGRVRKVTEALPESWPAGGDTVTVPSGSTETVEPTSTCAEVAKTSSQPSPGRVSPVPALIGSRTETSSPGGLSAGSGRRRRNIRSRVGVGAGSKIAGSPSSWASRSTLANRALPSKPGAPQPYFACSTAAGDPTKSSAVPVSMRRSR